MHLSKYDTFGSQEFYFTGREFISWVGYDSGVGISASYRCVHTQGILTAFLDPTDTSWHGGPIPRLGVTPGGRKLYH